jgi:hypothetical protein
MRKLTALLLFLLALAPLPAAGQATPNSYFQAGDTNPLLWVWETNSGAFVAPTSTNYLAYLRGLVGTTSQVSQVCGINNNGGAIQIQVCVPSLIGGWFTGQVKTVTDVGGVPGANGTFTITVDSIALGLVTLQGTTYTGSWASGGIIGAAPLIDTAYNLYAQIDQYNRFKYSSGQVNFIAQTITTGITLTNPLAPAYEVNQISGGDIVLPQANLPGSIPIGQPILFQNVGGTSPVIRYVDTSSLITLPAGKSIVLMLMANGSKDGSYIWSIGTN